MKEFVFVMTTCCVAGWLFSGLWASELEWKPGERRAARLKIGMYFFGWLLWPYALYLLVELVRQELVEQLGPVARDALPQPRPQPDEPVAGKLSIAPRQGGEVSKPEDV